MFVLVSRLNHIQILPSPNAFFRTIPKTIKHKTTIFVAVLSSRSKIQTKNEYSNTNYIKCMTKCNISCLIIFFLGLESNIIANSLHIFPCLYVPIYHYQCTMMKHAGLADVSSSCRVSIVYCLCVVCIYIRQFNYH